MELAPRRPDPPRRRDAGQILGGLIPQARFTTVIILLINTALFLAQQMNPVLAQAGASGSWHIDHMQPWRLVTAGFLHGGWLHLLMNSWVLFDLGAEVEYLYGTSRMIVYYFISTVCGFLTSSYFGGVPSLGSSAGIFGLLGALVAFGYTDRSSLGAAVKSLYGRWLIYFLVLSFIPGVDFYAHIGGLVSGFATGYLASTPRARAMGKEPFIRGAAAVCLLLTCVAFAMMFRFLMLIA